MSIWIRTKDGRAVRTELVDPPTSAYSHKVLVDKDGTIYEPKDIKRITRFPKKLTGELDRAFYLEPCFFK